MVKPLGVGLVDCELRFYCVVCHGGDGVERCASDAYEPAYAEDTDDGCFGEFVGCPAWVTARSSLLTFYMILQLCQCLWLHYGESIDLYGAISTVR